MATIYQPDSRYSDNRNYQNFSYYEHSNRQEPIEKSYYRPRVFHNLALVLEQGGSYLDKNTRHGINFILKHYNKLQETIPTQINSRPKMELPFSPNYNSTFMGFNLKSECRNHINHLSRDLTNGCDSNSNNDLIMLRKNLINLLNQIYTTL